MRLSILHMTDEERSQLGIAMPEFTGGPPSVMRHRPRFFGRAYGAAIRRGMGDSTRWSKGELELFAAFVSKLNRCLF